MTKLAPYRKFVAYVVGVVAEVVSAGILHGSALEIATGVVVIATGAGIYQASNQPIPVPVAPGK